MKEYIIYHFNQGRRDHFARVTGLDELHQWFRNIQVAHGGYITDELKLVMQFNPQCMYFILIPFHVRWHSVLHKVRQVLLLVRWQ